MKGNKWNKDNEFGVEVRVLFFFFDQEVRVFLHKIDCVLNGLWIYWVGSHIGTCDDLTILVSAFNILYPSNEKSELLLLSSKSMLWSLWFVYLFQKDVKVSSSIWLFVSNWFRGLYILLLKKKFCVCYKHYRLQSK